MLFFQLILLINIATAYYWIKQILIFIFIIGIFSGCSVRPMTEKVVIEGLPKGKIVRNSTYFEDSLVCMDRLFLQAGIKNILIGSDGLPDRTNRVRVGSRDMLIAALSKISTRSGAFRFVDYFGDRPVRGLMGLRNALDPRAKKLLLPVYYISGGITQVDSKVLKESYGRGLHFNNKEAYIANLNFNNEKTSSIVSMDMYIGRSLSRQVIPGLEASNSITITRSGLGAGFEARYKLHTIPFTVNIDKNEGTHAGVRLLIQLSLIESLGKLTGVPYWQCLGIPSTNPKKHYQTWKRYTALKQQERITEITAQLRKRNYLAKKSKYSQQELFNAITRYQQHHALIPNGQISFNLYYKLLGSH